MTSYKSIAILSIAVSWVLANTAWLSIGQEQLAGTELIQLLNLLPAIALLLIFISSYRKFQRSLLLSAALAMAGFSYLAIFSDLTKTAAAIKIYESLSGIQGAGPSDVEVLSISTLMPWFAAAFSLASLALTVLTALKPGVKAETKRLELEDNRALWDEQSD